jgi:hypothetical protein
MECSEGECCRFQFVDGSNSRNREDGKHWNMRSQCVRIPVWFPSLNSGYVEASSLESLLYISALEFSISI